jgi:hypothetical protein
MWKIPGAIYVLRLLFILENDNAHTPWTTAIYILILICSHLRFTVNRWISAAAWEVAWTNILVKMSFVLKYSQHRFNTKHAAAN